MSNATMSTDKGKHARKTTYQMHFVIYAVAIITWPNDRNS